MLELDIVFKNPFEMIFLFVNFLVSNGHIIEISKFLFILWTLSGFFLDFQSNFTIPITNNIFQYGI